MTKTVVVSLSKHLYSGGNSANIGGGEGQSYRFNKKTMFVTIVFKQKYLFQPKLGATAPTHSPVTAKTLVP